MNVSRPKNTDMSPEVEVSQPAGIHGWPGRDSSNPGFLSRFPVGAGAEAAGLNEAASARAAIAVAVRARRNRSMSFLSQRQWRRPHAAVTGKHGGIGAAGASGF